MRIRSNPMWPILLTSLGVALAPTSAGAADAPAEGKAETLTSGDVRLELPLGLQADAAYIPDSNPLSKAKVELGQALYYDGRLSADGNVPCAGCHNPYHGFADPEATSPGVGLKRGNRNSQTVTNRLFSAEQFWDGRAKDLEEQAHGPIVNPIEMALPSHDVAVEKISAVKGYSSLFEKAYGDSKVTMSRIAQAIASFERTVLSGDSPFDRWQAGDKTALSAQQVRGFELFRGKAACETCHVSFNFTDENYHNLGVGFDPTTKSFADKGRFDVTKKDADIGAFKTPTLRDIVLTAPYMHDGSEVTLESVVEFYDRGGNPNPTLDLKMKPLGLTGQEQADLVAFMQGLTGQNLQATPPGAKDLPR